MIRTILLPLDGTVQGEQVLAHATLIARQANAQLHLAHVLVPLVVSDPMMQYTTLDVETPREAKSYLADLVSNRLPTLPSGKPTITVILEGPVSEALTKYIEDNHIDLVVMANHGRSPFARAWLGSVSDEVTRSINAPVLLIRLVEDQPVAPPTEFRHVLLALDGTPQSEEMLGPAAEIARLFGASITLLHVIAPGAVRPTADQDLRHIANRLRVRNLKVETKVVEHEDAATAILNEAQRIGADLIAMETHVRGTLARLFLGSVTDRVAREAHCPVLVRHPVSDSQPGRDTMTTDELVTVYQSPDPVTARIIAADLTNAGIAATVSGENQGGFPGVSVISVDVSVHASDAERARNIIEEMERSAATVDEVEEVQAEEE